MTCGRVLSISGTIGLTVAALALSRPAHALGMATYKADSSQTATTIFGTGDRRLDHLGFQGPASNTFSRSNFLTFKDGRLWNNDRPRTGSPYGWTDEIPRDVDANDAHSGNPDRAATSTAFPGESHKTGTLEEAFGPFTQSPSVQPYKNMSRLIDGEDSGYGYTLDLLFAPDRVLSADTDATTVELTLLERGLDSDLDVYGIRLDGTLTDMLHVNHSDLGKVGWKLNSLEIGSAQDVGAIGISLDSTWQQLKGFRFDSPAGSDDNGPDLIAVGTIQPELAPEPGTLVILGTGLLGLARAARRRKCPRQRSTGE